VEGPRDQLLAGAGFAVQEHRYRQRRDARNGVVDLDDRRIVAHDHRLGAELDLGASPRGRLHGRVDPRHQGLHLEGLGEVIEDAEPARRGGGLDRPVGGHEDDPRVGAGFAGVLEELDAGAVSEIDVGDDHVEIRRLESLSRLVGRRRRANLESFLAEGQGHHLAHGRVVVDDENACRFHWLRLPRDRQPDHQGAAGPDLTLHFYASSVPIDHLLGEGKPQTGSGAG
jgi:hypothetical protein